MQAIEFQTTAKNGFIQIPDEYRKKIGVKLWVTIVNDEDADINWDERFPPTIDTKIWAFNREEANAR